MFSSVVLCCKKVENKQRLRLGGNCPRKHPKARSIENDSVKHLEMFYYDLSLQKLMFPSIVYDKEKEQYVINLIRIFIERKIEIKQKEKEG